MTDAPEWYTRAIATDCGLFAGAVEDPDISAAICRAYNRWLADYCKPYPDRLFGVAMIPLQSVDRAIEE